MNEIKRQLSSSLDWIKIVEKLETEAEQLGSSEEKARRFYEVGQTCEDLFLRKDRAMVNYKKAFTLQPDDTRPLVRAQKIYREMGNLDMVAKLLEYQIKNTDEPTERAKLLVELAEAYLCVRELELARTKITEAQGLDQDAEGLAEIIATLDYDKENWRSAVAELAEQAALAEDSETSVQLYVRAARICNVEEPEEEVQEVLLRQALEKAPHDQTVNFMLEGLLAEHGRNSEIMELHEKRASLVSSDEQAELYRAFASQWAIRFVDLPTTAVFYDRALNSCYTSSDFFPGHLAAFAFLREVRGPQGAWQELLQLADKGLGADLLELDQLVLAVQAAEIAWKEMDDPKRAAHYYEWVEMIDPENVLLLEFKRAQSGEEESDVETVMEAKKDTDEPEPESKVESKPRKEAKLVIVPDMVEEDVDQETAQMFAEATEAAAQSPSHGIDAWKKVAKKVPNLRTPKQALAALYIKLERWNPLVEVLKEEIEIVSDPDEKHALLCQMLEIYRDKTGMDVMVVNVLNQILDLRPDDLTILDELIVQYEKMKRWTDMINALRRKADATSNVKESVQIWIHIGRLFLERFSNKAEAIKAYEQVLELDPLHKEAINQLKDLYEGRRDWEKLIAVYGKEIEFLESDEERAGRYLEVAKLASSKLRRPDISTELWNKVLEYDPQNLEALGELEGLFEKSKDWGRLGEICRKQIELTEDVARKVQLLQKLGLLYSDKAKDDAKAIEAWRDLLDLDPDNRRAQDAIKKLYLDAKSYDELEEFYGKRGKWEEFVRVLERQVDSEEGESKLELTFKIANLWQTQLNKPERAIRSYEKVLSIDENNLQAAEELVKLYEGGRDFQKHVRVLQIQLEHTQDTTAQLEQIRYLAELCEEKIKDKDAAFDWYLKAFDVSPQEEWIRENAERLAKELSRWPDLVTVYEGAYRRLSDPSDLLPLLLTVGRVHEEELGNTEDALSTNRRILEIEPQNLQAVQALVRVFTKLGAWSDLRDMYERMVELTDDSDERKKIYFQLAYLYEEELEDSEKAVEVYRNILDGGDEDIQVLRALGNIYQAQERWLELGEVIQRELNVCNQDDLQALVDLKFRLAALRETHLDDIGGAVECYRDILEIDASHEGAKEALEGRLTDEAYQMDAAAVLAPIFTDLGEWHKLVKLYEIQLGYKKERGERIELLLQIGDLWLGKVGDGQQAFDAFSRCFKIDPTNEIARNELERLTNIQENWGALVELWDHATQEALDAPLLHELLVKLGRVADERLENTEAAIGYYRRAREIDPDDIETLDALVDLYTSSEKWSDLLECYRKKTELLTDPDEREKLFLRMAYLWEEMLGNLEEAVSCYNEVLSIDERNNTALKALDRLFQLQGSWHELADNLSRQLTMSESPDEGIELLVRLANLRETELSETAAAVDTYREVLGRDADNKDAVDALERLIENEEHQLVVAQTLEPVYRKSDDWQKLINVYEIMVRNAYDPARKTELLHQIAELYEIAAEDSHAAFEAYSRALHEDPANAETQSRLEKLARQQNEWQSLADLYQGLVADVMDEMLAIALHLKVATFYDENLENPNEAAKAYKRVLSLDPQHMGAINALEQLYIRIEAHEKLAEVLLLKADIVTDVEEKKGFLFRAAQVSEDVLEKAEEAIRVYRLVLEIDDADANAIEALERLYLRMEQWENLKDIFVRKVGLTPEPDEKIVALSRLGMLYEEQLSDFERAIETFQNIIDLEPEEVGAIRSLDRLYQKTERWYDLLQILERQVELAGNTVEGMDLRYRVGRLWEQELGDLTRAIETYREVLLIQPDHEATIAALDVLAHGEKEQVLAAQVLEPIYEQTAEWSKLVDLYEVMVQQADDVVRKIELLHQTAALYEQNLENTERAFEAYGRALREDSSNEKTLAHLERLADQTKGWESLAGLYEVELERLLDSVRQVDMGLRLARVYEEELNQPGSAIQRLIRVLEVDLDNRDAIMALDRLYQEGEHWNELAENMQRQLRMADTEEEIVDLHFRLGQLFQEEIKDLGNAVECYREILTIDPHHGPSLTSLELLLDEGVFQPEIAEILEPLYRMGEQWEKLVRVMEVQLEGMESAGEKVSSIQRIAESCEQRLSDPERAFRWWGKAFVFEPASTMVSEELERLAGIVDGWEELVGVYGSMADSVEVGDGKQLKKRIARIYDEELRDRAKAEENYLSVLKMDSVDNDALAALDRIYNETGMFRELVEILRRRIAVTDDATALFGLQLRLAEICDTALDDQDAAIAAYNEALETDTRNSTALDALERLYFERERWEELYSVYERMLDIAPGDSGIADCYARMAKISSDALGNADRAKDLWNRVLDLRGEDTVALWALADLYEVAEEWRELVEVLQRQTMCTADAKENIRLYERLGRIWGERLNRERNALENWEKVLEIDPGNVPALHAMVGLYRDMEAWEELAEALNRVIDIGSTGDMAEDELKELYVQLGEVHTEMLPRPDEAIGAWRKVLDVQSDHHRALDALQQLLTEQERWQECIQILEQKAQVFESVEDKIDVLMHAADIWKEKVWEPKSAGQVYVRVLQLDRSNEVAFNGLADVYREGAQWDKLAELLLDRKDFVQNTEEKVGILQEVAKLFEEKLGAAEDAFVVLQAAFKEDYTNDITARELERLASVTNSWNQLISDYSSVIQNISDSAVRADLLIKMGRWYGSKLERMDYAISSVEQALQIDAENAKALEALGELYRKTGNWTALVQILGRSVEVEDDPEKKVEHLLSMAELSDLHLSDQTRAINTYRRVLDLDGNNTKALVSLERMYRSDQRWEQLVEILEKKVVAAEEAETIIDLYGQIGELYEEKLGNLEKAIENYEEVLSIDPQDYRTLKALEALYQQSGAKEKYVDILEQQLDAAETDEARIALLERISNVWEEQFNRLDHASENLEKILLIDGKNEAAFRNLARIYLADSRHEELVEVFRRHIDISSDSNKKIELLSAMGKVYESEINNPDRAIEAYSEILSHDSEHTNALDALARLYEDTQAWDQAIEVMGQLVNLVDDIRCRVDLYYRMGRICEEQYNESERAEEHYYEALELNPSHAESMTQLVEIYKARGEWAKATNLMVRAEAHVGNELEKTRLLFEAGDAYLKHLGDEEMAAELFAKTLAIDPDHVKAGQPLSDIFFKDKKYEELEPVLDMLLRRADRRDNKRLQRLNYMLAVTADSLGKNEKALKCYQESYALDSTDLPTLMGMADLLQRMEDWSRAFKMYQTILVRQRDSQRKDEIVDVLYHLGSIKLKLGESKKALNMFEKALEHNPTHRKALEAIIELQSAQQNWDAVVSAKRALMEIADAEQRFDLLRDVGDILRDKLNNPQKAIVAYESALELRPEAHPIIHVLVDLFTKTAQWKKTVEMIVRLTDITSDSAARAKIFYTAAVICRDEM
ncbi:MAG: tetratricopeptide repeat protein, partial [Pseudomonadota bacterium]